MISEAKMCAREIFQRHFINFSNLSPISRVLVRVHLLYLRARARIRNLARRRARPL